MPRCPSCLNPNVLKSPRPECLKAEIVFSIGQTQFFILELVCASFLRHLSGLLTLKKNCSDVEMRP